MNTPVNMTSHRKSGVCRGINRFFFISALKHIYRYSLEPHLLSALKHRFRVLIRIALMKNTKIISFLFHICISQRLVPLMGFQAYMKTEMEGAGVLIVSYS